MPPTASEDDARPRGNYQMTVGLMLPHQRCPTLRGPRILDSIAQTWIACRPILDVILSGRNTGRQRRSLRS
jgi:hypothetical protein